jgi:hypothetical protein
MRRISIIMLLAVALSVTACRGGGFARFDSNSFWNNKTEQSEANKKWFDRYYGRKAGGHESSAWKEFYGPAADPVPKYEHCGFWGNCAAPGVTAAPAPAAASSCSFYGTCDSKKSSGWGW